MKKFLRNKIDLINDFYVQQLTKDAKPMIKNTQGLSHHEIAELEIKHNVSKIRPKPPKI